MTRREQEATLQGHQDRVWQVSWNPIENPPVLLSCSGDKSIKMWKKCNEKEWKCIKTLDSAHERTVRGIEWNRDGRVFASSSFDATCGVWEREKKNFSKGSDEEIVECIANLEGHENEVKSVAWSVSGSLLATCSRDKSVWIWEAMGDGDFECIAVLQEHTQDVKYVKWHPNEDILISCSYDDTIRVWVDHDDDDWSCSQVLEGHTSTVWAVDFDQTGDFLFSVSDDLSMKIWKRDQKKYEHYLTVEKIHSRTIYSVSVNLPLIATCGADNTICISQLIEEKHLNENVPGENTLNDNPDCKHRLKMIEKISDAHGDRDVNCVSWCKVDGYTNYLASCGDDGLVKIWSF